MKVKVNGKEVELSDREATINGLLKLIEVNREAVLVAVNGEISIEEARLSEGDEVRLISVVSGG
ncbi:MAG: MoaD/ThiS family protein [Candidatus Hydrothermarchaeales archaeon]